MGKKKRENKPRAIIAGPPPLELLEPGAPLPKAYRGLLILMFVLLALLAVRQIGGLDAGFHLKAGGYILSGHGWPNTDGFSYTLNTHPYTDTSWGYQVLLTLAEKICGAPGMVVFHLLILMGIFLLLYKTARLVPVDGATVVLFMGAGVVACEMRYDIRPELLSYLLLTTLLYLLHRHALGFNVRLWLLPVVMGVWANSHALFVLGWVALLCVAAGLWIRDRKPDKPLLWWTGAAFVAPLVNPYGLKGVLFPFTLLTRYQAGNIFADTIKEFISPFALHSTDPLLSFPPWPVGAFRVLAVLLLPALILLLKQRRYWAVLVCLAFAPLEIKMLRNMPLLIVTALPAMMWTLPVSGLWRLLKVGERRARLARNVLLAAGAVAAVVLGLRILTGAYYLATRRPEHFGWSWNREMLPVDAAQFAQRAGLRGTMFNHLRYGGYLMWALPNRVFIDGRLEVVGEKFYGDYLEILSSKEAFDRAASAYGFDWVVLPYTAAGFLVSGISGDSRWRLTYVDPLAVIFVRAGPGAEKTAGGAPIMPRPPDAPTLDKLPGLGGPQRASPLIRWLSGMIIPARYPWLARNLGSFHYFRNELSDAETWFRAAVAGSGGAYAELYLNLGSSLFEQKKFDDAASCFEIVLQDEPENGIARHALDAIMQMRMTGRQEEP